MQIPRFVTLVLGGIFLGVLVAYFVSIQVQTPNSPRPMSGVTTTSVNALNPSEPLEPIERTDSAVDLATSEQAPPPLVTSSQITSGELATTTNTATQYVVLAFDGSRSIDMWKETQRFAKEMTEQGAPVHFTYFINAVYLLAWQHRDFYHPPQHATGSSPIGFASSEKDVANRLEQMNAALDNGHEIGCHLTGHFNGSTWSEAEWRQEFKSFFDIIGRVSELNHLETEPVERRGLNMGKEGFTGFRAPELGVNKHLWPVLKDYKFQYDTSLTDKPGVWPSRRAQGMWEFPLTRIKFAGSSTSSLLSMDYNFYFKQSKAIEAATRGTPLWDEYYTQVLTSYRDYFNQSYQGNRAPIFIGHHFSLWNDGVYWEAMKTFAREVCSKPNVKCTTYKDVMKDLNKQAIQ